MIRITYLTLGFTLLLLTQCSNHEEALEKARNIQQYKEYPNDLFSFQRSYPYRKFDTKAYEAGLQSSIAARNQRNNAPGFDAAWMNRGPGRSGARINSIEVHPTDEDIIYLGYATGGVFRTTDGGANWNPIFDDQPFLAIGDIAMDPSDTETIYVGTGDPNITGYPAIGNGIYKSTDGGTTWTHLGLSDQRIVSKIIIDPLNPNTVYASCMGLPFERNNDRGLYKSVDGGLNWEQILFVSNQAGIIDMVINPDDPQILYAASWDRIRNNEESIVFGPNAKIHKTVNGGQNWEVLTNGLPTGEQGRIGLAMADSDSDILVCMYVGQNQQLEGIYRTENAGDSWTAIPTSNQNGLDNSALGGFGWYFGKIRIHPINDQWIYLLGITTWFTSNNGTLWASATGGSTTVPHVDHHDLVFNFERDILLATDGGAYKKENGSFNYADIESIPATQFYRVSYDPHRPQNYYGGSQDNGSWGGDEAVSNDTWGKLLGGDGFQMRFHPTDSNVVYAETQNGNIFRSTTGLSGFTSFTTGIGPNDRRHWDMQYIISPHDPDRLYTGTFKLYTGLTSNWPVWESISPDLTDGNIFGNSFHTITTIDESPLQEGLLYVGTTDANVWRSENGGTDWDSLHADLPNRYITSIKASPEYVDQVYLTISGYRYNEHFPRVYKSTDRGTNWTSIAGNLPDIAVNDILILPGQEDQILFVATDGGIFGTTNGGTTWHALGTGMPIVTTYDLEWNEVNNELIAGTFGRAIYTYPIDTILNNLSEGIIIAGNVRTESGQGIDSVMISSENQTIMVDENGDYLLQDITLSANCEVVPQKDINIRNGLSTFDLLLMQSHILFVDTLDSPYKIIAGDVNNSGSLSTFDIVLARKVLLFDSNTFPNSESWRFIPADFEFTNPESPFLDDFPEGLDCAAFQNGPNADFIGIKVGDVNGSANPGMLTNETAEQRTDPFLDFYIENEKLKRGKEYQIPVRIKEAQKITGFQFALNLNAPVYFEGIEASAYLNLEANNYSFKENVLRISWSDPQSVDLTEGAAIFYLKIKALADLDLSEIVVLEADNQLRPEVYDRALQIFEPRIIIEKQENEIATPAVLYPNPMQEQSTLSFFMESQGEAELRIFALNGQLVFSSQSNLSAGEHSFLISKTDLKDSGIYLYELIKEGQRFKGKFVVN